MCICPQKNAAAASRTTSVVNVNGMRLPAAHLPAGVGATPERHDVPLTYEHEPLLRPTTPAVLHQPHCFAEGSAAQSVHVLVALHAWWISYTHCDATVDADLAVPHIVDAAWHVPAGSVSRVMATEQY